MLLGGFPLGSQGHDVYHAVLGGGSSGLFGLGFQHQAVVQGVLGLEDGLVGLQGHGLVHLQVPLRFVGYLRQFLGLEGG